MKEKILLDTDIGSDIDDSFALGYLLSQKDCDLLGVTTVSGDADRRARMASVMCRAAGRNDIPIYVGTETPLLAPQRQPLARQAGVLDKWAHETSFPKGAAVEFMRQTIRKHPGEVTLLAIGPMTNAALLFAIDPEIPSLLKQLVVMCGVFTYKLEDYVCLNEWNASCDPHATAILYNAPIQKVRSIGLDVTTRVTMKKRDFAAAFRSDVMRPLYDFTDVWDDPEGLIIFHDPLAAATIFDNEICAFKQGEVFVELESARTRGMTYFHPENDGNDEVAMDVDADAFFRHYIDVVENG
jgi:inosine-uridine nucleoside N-ribohydrolase